MKEQQYNREQVKNLYTKLYGPDITIINLNNLAAKLSQVAARNRPWTGKYLHSLLRGYPGFSVNEQLARAIQVLVDLQSGTDDIEAGATVTTVRSLHPLPEHAIVLGHACLCANPGCAIVFVPTHPRQKFHSKKCARAAARHRISQISSTEARSI